MQCWQCGRTVRRGARLCIYCGATLADDDNAADEPTPRGSSASRRDKGSARDVQPRRPRPSSYEDDAGEAPDDRSRGAYRASRAPDASRDASRRRAEPARRNDDYNGDFNAGTDDGSTYQPHGSDAPYIANRGQERTPRSNDRRDPPYQSRAAFVDESAAYGAVEAPRHRSARSYDYADDERYATRNPRSERGSRNAGYVDGADADHWTPPSRAARDPQAGNGSSARGRSSANGSRGPTPGAARGRAGQSRNGARGGARAKRSRRGPIVGIIIALLVVAIIAGGAVLGTRLSQQNNAPIVSSGPPFATYTPGPTPTPPAKYTELVSDRLGYVASYPQGWSETASSDTSQAQYDYWDTFTQASPQAVVVIEQAGAFNSVTDLTLINDEVASSEKAGNTFTAVASTAATQTIGGEQWQRRDFAFTKSGTKLHMAILSCHHRGRGFVIVLVSLPENFVQDEDTTFKTMLSTFRFLK